MGEYRRNRGRNIGFKKRGRAHLEENMTQEIEEKPLQIFCAIEHISVFLCSANRCCGVSIWHAPFWALEIEQGASSSCCRASILMFKCVSTRLLIPLDLFSHGRDINSSSWNRHILWMWICLPSLVYCFTQDCFCSKNSFHSKTHGAPSVRSCSEREKWPQ